jgi:hypothetical protein
MSEPKELRKKALRLINEARPSMHPKRRQMLIAEAFELLQQADSLSRCTSGESIEARLEPERYRICFLWNDRIALWIDLDVDSKADAVWVASSLQEACADEYGAFELWLGLACILGNEGDLGWNPLASSADISAATQRRLLETEEALLNSRQAIARSSKLLAATEQLRREVGERGLLKLFR